ncbi:hypothetical protein CDAR_60011 [Caerostris darwini]|uniref:Uncharacterized protein n=1 Tax=Caerostris darwini TaxID=1538125 RepID=A0AAV4MQ80_9ARAC|nr:hypothetical protein CDAR_60011 [Caerostris darwini]
MVRRARDSIRILWILNSILDSMIQLKQSMLRFFFFILVSLRTINLAVCINNLKKDELIKLAFELGLTVEGDKKMTETRNLIQESEVFKTETNLVNSIIESVKESVEAEKRERSQRLEINKMKAIQNLEAEQLKLRQLEKETGLENLRKERLTSKLNL